MLVKHFVLFILESQLYEISPRFSATRQMNQWKPIYVTLPLNITNMYGKYPTKRPNLLRNTLQKDSHPFYDRQKKKSMPTTASLIKYKPQHISKKPRNPWIPINVFYLFLAGFTEIELQNTVYCLWNLILYWWKHPRKEERREKHLICLGDHPCIMSAKRWVGGWSEKLQFLLIFSTIYADVDVGGWVGGWFQKRPKIRWRNIWTVPRPSFSPDCIVLSSSIV